MRITRLHPQFTGTDRAGVAPRRAAARSRPLDCAHAHRRLGDPRERVTDDASRPVIAERGPIDFLAYLAALESLHRRGRSVALFDRGLEPTSAAMRNVDLLVVLPLHHRDDLPVADDEDPELRAAMDEALLELVDDPDLVSERTRVVEVSGDRSARLAAVERAIAAVGL